MAETTPKRKRVQKAEPVVAEKTEVEIVDPRQVSFLDHYFNPESPTFGNATQSAIAAGFSESYADNLLHLMPDWLSGYIGKEATKSLARRHVDDVLRMPIITQAMGAFGPIFEKIPTGRKKKVRRKNKETGVMETVEEEIFDQKPIMVYNPSLIKEKSNVAKLALEALDEDFKKKGSSGGPKFVFNITPKGGDKYKT